MLIHKRGSSPVVVTLAAVSTILIVVAIAVVLVLVDLAITIIAAVAALIAVAVITTVAALVAVATVATIATMLLALSAEVDSSIVTIVTLVGVLEIIIGVLIWVQSPLILPAVLQVAIVAVGAVGGRGGLVGERSKVSTEVRDNTVQSLGASIDIITELLW